MATKALSRAEIDELARKLFNYLTEDDENALLRLRHDSPSEREAFQRHLARDNEGRLELVRHNDLETARELVEQLLEKERVAVPIGPNEYWRLCQLALRAYAEAGRQREAKFEGNFGFPIQDKIFEPAARSAPPPPPPPTTSVAVITFPDLIKRHVADMARSWTKQTQSQNAATFRFLEEMVGAGEVAGIRRNEISDFNAAMSELPASYGQSRMYRDKSLQQIVGIAAKLTPPPRRITQKTLNRHMSVVSGLFSWADKHGYWDGKNPASGFIDKKRANENAGKRRAWRPEEIKALLDCKVWRGSSVERNGRFFVPLLGLYAGLSAVRSGRWSALVPPDQQALRKYLAAHHHKPRLRRLAPGLRRRQDDHRHARSPHPSLRHRRDRQHQLALQKPQLRKTLPRTPTQAYPRGCTGTSHGRLRLRAWKRAASAAGPSYALRG